MLLETALLAMCRDPAGRITEPPKPNEPDSSLAARGPLRVLAANPRYFSADGVRAVYLAGSHTWDVLQDWGAPTPPLDFQTFLNFLGEEHHNFIRFWIWEQRRVDTRATSSIAPLPWARTGPGLAADGLPRFDLARFDTAFFDRLRARVRAAGERGIYVSIMLFQYYVDWPTHPFNPANNVNRIDADADGDGDGRSELHTLRSPAVTALQEAYVRHVIDAVGDLENVLFEIGNEHPRSSLAWQRHMVDVIRGYEVTRPLQHPVGMTSTGGGADALSNEDLMSSAVDWISPRVEPGQDYALHPPAADGRKVILTDSDHLDLILGSTDPGLMIRWVWTSFLRGLNPILMDPWQNGIPGHGRATWNDPANPALPAARRALRGTREYAERIPLAAMTPRPELASSGYCLASTGVAPSRLLIYVREAEAPLARAVRWRSAVTVHLDGLDGLFAVEWFDPVSGTRTPGGVVAGNDVRSLRAPFPGDAVLYLAPAGELAGKEVGR